ncbi:MAG: heavy metal translocating P-type ATPase [Phycisphaeraceae bacterium]|nr:heavy metal translocating P-type ATPase [Phycisphaerales bacterium]MCB9859914.1 heavy metal translocating P-type ATPase [Phycisphaeraceae bacterium]
MTDQPASITTRNVRTAARLWRDHGWRRAITRKPPRIGDDRVCAVIPLMSTGSDAFDAALIAQCQTALNNQPRLDTNADRLADIATVHANPARVVLRYHAGGCPVEEVAAALMPLGVAPQVTHCRDATLTPVTLTVRGGEVEALPAQQSIVHVFLGVKRRALHAAKLVTLSPELAMVLLGGAILLTTFVLGRTTELPMLARYGLLAISAILTSTRTFPEAMRSVLGFQVNIDVLMFAAAGGAAAIGHPEEGALLLFLFGLGSAGEHLAMSHARRSIEALSDLAPRVATVVNADGSMREVPIENIEIGQTVRIRAFDRVPIDGIVTQGQSSVDETMLTGEPIPVEKVNGSNVFAGTMNMQGVLTVRVTQLASDTTLARIMRLVEDAQEAKSKAQLFTDRVETFYVPMVFVLTACVMVIPPLLKLPVLGADTSWGTWFYRSMAFMTAASPCALAIGTPATILCAVARAARMGVLVKGGAAMDTLARANAIAFDKTGTLTEGKPEVVRIVVAGNAEDIDENRLLAIAAAIEQSVTHPLADAVVRAAQSRSVVIPGAADVGQIAGSGAYGTVDGSRIDVVKPSAVTASWTDDLARIRDELATQGSTIIVVARNHAPIGIIALDDRIRSETSQIIDQIRAQHVSPLVMLTGDHEGSAARVASELHLDEYFASLTPDEKLRRIEQFQQDHGVIAMVGDGVNDAPALAQANVGIAIGAAHSHVAMETADVALLGSTLANLPGMIGLARAARRILMQNLIFAMMVIVVVAPLGALGFANLGIAVLLHEGSTILVVLNSLRLLGFHPAKIPGQGAMA